MDAEQDIQFITMPNQDAHYPRVSMVLPVVDELLAALNDGFNPYVDQIRASDLQVLVRNSDGSYSVTGGTPAGRDPCPGPEAAGPSSGGGQTADEPGGAGGGASGSGRVPGPAAGWLPDPPPGRVSGAASGRLSGADSGWLPGRRSDGPAV